MSASTGTSRDVIPLREAAKAWFAISLQTFGGPAGQIAVMQRTLVEEKRWIGQQRFLFALSYCTLLPGPEAQQLATYVGWLLNGVRGALVAGILFVLPGVVALLVLSAVYVAYGDTTLVESLFLGLAPAVIAIVVQAVVRVGRKGLGHPALVALAVASFVALTFFGAPFPAVVLVAALAGWVLGRRLPGADQAAEVGRRRRTAAAHQRRPAPHRTTVRPPGRAHPRRRSGRVVRPGRRRGARCSAGRARSSTRACSSRAPPSSPSAVPTPSWPTSRSRPSRSTAGCCRARWSAASRSPRPPPGR